MKSTTNGTRPNVTAFTTNRFVLSSMPVIKAEKLRFVKVSRKTPAENDFGRLAARK
jgi:hypothetical protein